MTANLPLNRLIGANPLKAAHAALGAAVLDAYGFSSNEDLLAQLLNLNNTIAKRLERGESVTAPGIQRGRGGVANRAFNGES